jgi:hypothetical protein
VRRAVFFSCCFGPFSRPPFSTSFPFLCVFFRRHRIRESARTSVGTLSAPFQRDRTSV